SGLPAHCMLQLVCCVVQYPLATRGGSMVNWHDLATTSHYQTAVAIKHALSAGDTEHARIGIEELIEALARADRRALESYLIRLMQYIIKWHVQPECRSPSWAATIRTARRPIARLQRDTPS